MAHDMVGFEEELLLQPHFLLMIGQTVHFFQQHRCAIISKQHLMSNCQAHTKPHTAEPMHTTDCSERRTISIFFQKVTSRTKHSQKGFTPINTPTGKHEDYQLLTLLHSVHSMKLTVTSVLLMSLKRHFQNRI